MENKFIPIPFLAIDDALLKYLAEQATASWHKNGTPVPLNPLAIQHAWQLGWSLGFRTAEVYHAIRNATTDGLRQETGVPPVSDDIRKLVSNRVDKLLVEIMEAVIKRAQEIPDPPAQ